MLHTHRQPQEQQNYNIESEHWTDRRTDRRTPRFWGRIHIHQPPANHQPSPNWILKAEKMLSWLWRTDESVVGWRYSFSPTTRITLLKINSHKTCLWLNKKLIFIVWQSRCEEVVTKRRHHSVLLILGRS